MVDEDGDHATVWVENGWLMAERRTAANELEWQIVLAKVENDPLPQIESNAEYGTFRLSFREGRYFIRDEKSNTFRCLRQRKTDEAWPHLVLPPGDPDSKDFSASRKPPNAVNDPAGPAIPALEEMPAIFERTINSWQYVAVGPATDAIDGILRLSQRDIDSEKKVVRNLITSSFSRLVQARHSDSHNLIDDGELLVANRLEQWEATQELKRLARKAELIGKPPRELTGGDWINSDRPLSWEDWQGRVVLLEIERGGDLEGSWLILSSLARKYADRGLVIVGIANDVENGKQRAEWAAALGKHNVTWPFKIEKSGAAATDYQFPFYSHPHYVLVGRDGKVAWIGEKRSPREAEIEKLLEAQ